MTQQSFHECRTWHIGIGGVWQVCSAEVMASCYCTVFYRILCVLDAGDGRVNEQIGLISLHTVFHRGHNTLEDELHHINPHWRGERLFQVSNVPCDVITTTGQESTACVIILAPADLLSMQGDCKCS